MSNQVDNEQIEFSSGSDPEDIDLEDINEIRVDAADLDELDQLFATTKQDLCMICWLCYRIKEKYIIRWN